MALNIVRGRVTVPMRRVVFGPAGVGKSTFAATRKVIALDCEQGLGHVGCDRVPWEPTWDGNKALIREMCIGKGDWDTVMLDTIDALEQQAARELCAKSKKESLADFGYGDGYFAVAAKWRELLFLLEEARSKGRAVHLVGHVVTSTVKDPTLPKDHQKFIAALTKHSWAATHQWADAVLFADYERGMVEGRAIHTGNRVLRTKAGTGYDAKHRPNIPDPLPLSWVAYERECKRFDRTAEQVRKAIEPLRASAKDQDKLSAAIALAGEDVEQLVSIERTLESRQPTVGGNGAGEGKVEQAS